MAVKDMKNDELVDHYYELKHLNADDAETAKYYKELVREMAERFAIMIENEAQDHCGAINRDCDDPGYTQILIKNNGEAVAVSTKWDITIHCDSEEEQKHVMELLEKFDEQEPVINKIRAEIEPKCDRINSLASVLPYTAHREIQELLCEILDLCKAESMKNE